MIHEVAQRCFLSTHKLSCRGVGTKELALGRLVQQAPLSTDSENLVEVVKALVAHSRKLCKLRAMQAASASATACRCQYAA